MSTFIHNELEKKLMDLGLSSVQAAEVAFQTTPYAKELVLLVLSSATDKVKKLEERVEELQERISDLENTPSQQEQSPDAMTLKMLRRAINEMESASIAINTTVDELREIEGYAEEGSS